jgi:hypothetical protein
VERWSKRSPEIANLLSPSFCATILYATASEHQKKSGVGMDFPLTYLVLPIILHKDTREKVNSKSNMVVWLQRNPDVLIGFPDRARSLAPFTNEAIEFMLYRYIINVDGGKLTIQKPLSKSIMDKYSTTDSEVTDCIRKSAHLGRWFINMRSAESIYTAWGVKP